MVFGWMNSRLPEQSGMVSVPQTSHDSMVMLPPGAPPGIWKEQLILMVSPILTVSGKMIELALGALWLRPEVAKVIATAKPIKSVFMFDSEVQLRF